MKLENIKYIRHHVRVDVKLRQFARLVCAVEGIKNRRELCKKSFEYYVNSENQVLIAPARKGILFLVELPLAYKESLDGLVEESNSNISRVFHTAIYSYIENFKNKNPELFEQLLTKVVI